MPVLDNLYIDRVSARTIATRTKAQQTAAKENQTQVTQANEDELMKVARGQKLLKAQKMDEPIPYANKHSLGPAPGGGGAQVKHEQFMPSNVLIEHLGLEGHGIGKAAARGIIRGLAGIVDYPFALYNFAKQAWHAKPNFKFIENYKSAARTLAQPEVATEIGVGTATGLMLGYGASKVVGRIADIRARTTVRNMAFDKSRMYVPSPEEIMQRSPFQSLRTFKTAGGKWGVTEKGVGMSVTAMDKNRGFISVIRYKNGAEYGGTAKSFMPSYKAKLLGISKRPYFIQDVGGESGGVPASYYQQQALIGRNILPGRTARITPKAYLTHILKTEYPSVLRSEIEALAPAVHVAEGAGGVGVVSSALSNIKKPTTKKTFHSHVDLGYEDNMFKIARGQKLLRAQTHMQKHEEKLTPTPIMTHAQSLIEQIKQGLGQGEQQKQKIRPRRSDPPIHEPQIEELVPISRQMYPQAQKQEPKQETKIAPALAPITMLGAIKPPSLRLTKIKRTTPLRIRISPKPSRKALLVRLKKAWARKVEWGDIRLLGGRKQKERNKSKGTKSREKGKKNRRR